MNSTAPTAPTANNDHPQTGPIVQISVNGTNYPIHRGRQTVAEVKEAGQVAAADVLEQLIDGQLVPLADDGSVVIHGGEQFVSHIRGGSSS